MFNRRQIYYINNHNNHKHQFTLMTFLRVIVRSLVPAHNLLSLDSVTCHPHFIKGVGRAGPERQQA